MNSHSLNGFAVSTEPEQLAAPARKANKARLIFLVLAVVVIGLLTYRWWHGSRFVSTDNAQIEGHIIPILPKVGGFVGSVAVADNQIVAAGTPLVQLDPRDYEARLAQADADLMAALAQSGEKGQLGIASAQMAAASASASAARETVSAAQAQLTQAQAALERAQKDYDRTVSLVAQKMVSPQQLDSADAQLKEARAHVDAVRAQQASAQSNALAAGSQVNASNAGVKQAIAKVQGAQASRDYAALQLEYTHILAPMAGQISKKAVEPGQLVQAGQQLMVLVPTTDVWVVANFKETDIGRIRAGQKVDIEADSYPGQHFVGVVDSLSAATGAKFSMLPPDNATGNFTKVVQRLPVKIRLEQWDIQKYPLRPGMSVLATVRVN